MQDPNTEQKKDVPGTTSETTRSSRKTLDENDQRDKLELEPPSERWPAWQTSTFVILSSIILWAVIIFVFTVVLN